MPRPTGGYFHPLTKKRLAGVTTFPGIIWEPYKSKNMLDWAVALALNFEDGELKPIYHEWDRDLKGLVGTFTHAFSIAEATRVGVDSGEYADHYLYSPDILDMVKPYFDAFCSWWYKQDYHIIEYETPMINLEDEYGGTPDIVAKEGILDIKTGFIDRYSCCLQLSAYSRTWELNHGDKLGGTIIGFKDTDEGKEVVTYDYSYEKLCEYYKDFIKIKDVYYSKQQFEKETGDGRNTGIRKDRQ